MVRFSDLKDADLDSGRKKPDRKKDADVPERRPSSFRQLESEREHVFSDSDSHEKDFTEEDIKDLYEEASNYLSQVFDAIRQRKKFELEQGIQIIEKMVASHQAIDSLFVMALHHDDKIKFWIKACVNVAIYAIKMAENLGFKGDRQVEIGLAGLLHDVGMGLIPESIISKKEKLSEQEFQIFKDRPKYAFKILEAFEDKYAYLAECAYQVNERLDGSGYPRDLKGDEIHEYALIIGLVDTYEALVHSRPQREKFLHFSAVKEIIKTGKGHYHKHHLKALLNIFSIFPPYSYVRLNSDAIGQVIKTYPDQPLRPKLKIIYDSQGKKVLTDRIDNLADNPLLYIVDSVAEEDLKTLSFRSESVIFSPEKPERKKDIPSLKKADDKHRGKPETSRPIKSKKEDTGRVKKSNWYRKALIPLIFAGIGLLLLVFWGIWKDGPKTMEPGPSRQFVKNKIVDSPQAPMEDASKPETVSETARQVMTAPETPDETVVETARQVMTVPETPNETIPATARQVMTAPETPIEPQLSETLEEKSDSEQLAVENVETEALKTPLKRMAESEMKASAKDELYPYSILLASFRGPEGAKETVARYSERGLAPYWIKVNLGDGGIWYRVFAGYFKTMQEAEEKIERLNLENALVKKTRFAALIGTYSSEDETNSKIRSLMETEYSPYAILGKTGDFRLYLGAFYTKEGAETQCLELISKGISCEIVER